MKIPVYKTAVLALKQATKTFRNVSYAASKRVIDVVPSVLHIMPKQICHVSYPTGVEVLLGNELVPTKVRHLPTVKWDAFDNLYYCLTMTDPDFPHYADPRYGEMLHWMLVNIQGFNISRGETLAPYVPCVPVRGTGLHRYVFTVYRQPGRLDFDEPILTKDSFDRRENFSSKSFADKYKLLEPLAYNWFVARWDSYVPKILEKYEHNLF